MQTKTALIRVRPSIFYPLFLFLILFRLFSRRVAREGVRDTVMRVRCAALKAVSLELSLSKLTHPSMLPVSPAHMLWFLSPAAAHVLCGL